MERPQNKALKLFTEMKSNIEKAGSVFCQYRACNLTIDNANQKVLGLKQFIQSLDYELAHCDVMKLNIPVRN